MEGIGESDGLLDVSLTLKKSCAESPENQGGEGKAAE
jgi:hypothetical protein